ncbi:hypothetical protein [Pseudarthrobacter sp. S6]|uniref:hypothetical protein n=1 Tax=Pseudarthrobacter sp. S6 TaxID=3418420 RepID=UPI003CF34EB3
MQRDCRAGIPSNNGQRAVAPAGTDDVHHCAVPDEVADAIRDVAVIPACDDRIPGPGPQSVAERHCVLRVHGTLDCAVGLGTLVEHADGVVVRRDEDGRAAGTDVCLPVRVGMVHHVQVAAVVDP